MMPASLTHSSALAWLLDVRQRLNVSIDLVDHGLTPLLPAAPRRVRRSQAPIDLDDQLLHPAILGSMRSLKQESVSVDGVNLVSTPIVGADGRAAGALLVSDRSTAHGPGSGGQRELARIGAWLAGSIDAQFATALASHAQEFQRLASLHRLLTRVTKGGSELELVRSFMDAVAVWHDAESWGYVRDLGGWFLRTVSLPGSHDASAPRSIPDEALAAGPVIRLSIEERDTLGFHGAGDVLLARVSGQAGAEWLIAVRSAVAQSEARLALYVDVLGRALTAVAGVESSQLTWAMLLHLMQSDDPPEAAAARAIDEVSNALRADVSFLLAGRDGGALIAVGPSAPRLLAAGHGDEKGWLAVPVKVAVPFTAALGVTRENGEPLTRADEHLLQSAALTFAFWLNGVVDRLPGGGERRAARSFEQVVEQAVRDARARREHVSLAVLSFGTRARIPQAARTWIGRIRASLRPADLAGWLSTGDIAILLPDTPNESARLVVDRLRTLLASDPGADNGQEAAAVSIRIASRAPDDTASNSLLHETLRRRR